MAASPGLNTSSASGAAVAPAVVAAKAAAASPSQRVFFAAGLNVQCGGFFNQLEFEWSQFQLIGDNRCTVEITLPGQRFGDGRQSLFNFNRKLRQLSEARFVGMFHFLPSRAPLSVRFS